MQLKVPNKRAATILFVAASIVTTNACSPYIVAGVVVGTGAVIAVDRRNVENMFEDQAIELRATDTIYDDPLLGTKVKIDIISYNGIVLLTGYAPTESMREHAGHIIYSVKNVKEVYNEIRVGPRPTGEQTASDAWVTTKSKTLIIGKRGFPTHTKVVTVDGIVYLMGLATGEESRRAQEALNDVNGVKEVIALFEPLDTSMQDILRASGERIRKVERPAPSSTTKSTTPSEEDDFKIMPYKIEKPSERPAGSPTD